jgi:hypothetical protein
MKRTTTMPTTQPKKMPRMKRLGLLPLLGVKPQAPGKKYWLVVMTDSRRA